MGVEPGGGNGGIGFQEENAFSTKIHARKSSVFLEQLL